jgi:tagatose 6-phosphate kinase
MILTVTLNASLDVSYSVERLSDGEPVRVRDVSMRPGGKGINVAMVLAALGTDVTATGLAGGHRGELIRERLAWTEVNDALVPIAAESRQTVVAVADDGSFAEYDERGTGVSAEDWEGFLAVYRQLLDRCATVVCAGSLPGDIPDTAYATLVCIAHDRGRTVVLDAGGPALVAGIEAGPDVVKVNRAELAALVGAESVEAAVNDFAERTGGTVIVTSGSSGAIAAGDGWRYRVRPPARSGNPVGAGDAFTAGLLADSLAGAAPTERLAFATAIAASAVGMPCAGTVDLGLAKELLDRVEVEPW